MARNWPTRISLITRKRSLVCCIT